MDGSILAAVSVEGGNPWLALIALTAMEIVLGIDNVVFLAILSDKLPEHQQALARRVGLGLAMLMRILLLFCISAVVTWTEPIFTLSGILPFLDFFLEQQPDTDEISWRDIMMLSGGLFLIGKSVFEIHEKIEHQDTTDRKTVHASLAAVLTQIVLLDAVFSIDSVITAVGMARDLWVMVVAVILAVSVMLVFAGQISAFVSRHPTLKILALSFLILIGVMLLVDGLGTHIDKGYIYFAMAFALVVEILNMQVRPRLKRRAAHSDIQPTPPPGN